MKRTCLAILLLVGVARAQDASAPAEPPPAPPITTPVSESSFFYEGKSFGLQLDAGAPTGVALGIVWRPWYFLRVNGAVAHDAIAFGFKGGVTLIPFHFPVVPTLGLEAGHFLDGDVNSIATINDPTTRILLSKVGFSYLSADLGLEFGSQETFVFYIRAGLFQLFSNANNLQQAIDEANKNSGSPARVKVSGDPEIRGRGPAARLGFIWYIF